MNINAQTTNICDIKLLIIGYNSFNFLYIFARLQVHHSQIFEFRMKLCLSECN